MAGSHARGTSRARLAQILLNLLAAKPFRGEHLGLKMGFSLGPLGSSHHVAMQHATRFNWV